MTQTVGKVYKNGVEFRIVLDNTKMKYILKAKYYNRDGNRTTRTVDKFDNINHALGRIIAIA